MKTAFKLDPYTTKLVNQYADTWLREPVDIVNGLVAGQLEHAFENEERDDSMGIIHEQVLVSAKARKKMERS